MEQFHRKKERCIVSLNYSNAAKNEMIQMFHFVQ
jgi:hypothetical protein